MFSDFQGNNNQATSNRASTNTNSRFGHLNLSKESLLRDNCFNVYYNTVQRGHLHSNSHAPSIPQCKKIGTKTVTPAPADAGLNLDDKG
jgi:hypothetical protein